MSDAPNPPDGTQVTIDGVPWRFRGATGLGEYDEWRSSSGKVAEYVHHIALNRIAALEAAQRPKPTPSRWAVRLQDGSIYYMDAAKQVRRCIGDQDHGTAFTENDLRLLGTLPDLPVRLQDSMARAILYHHHPRGDFDTLHASDRERWQRMALAAWRAMRAWAATNAEQPETEAEQGNTIRKVYYVIDAAGNLSGHEFASLPEAGRKCKTLDAMYPQHAPHLVSSRFERQPAAQERSG